MWSREGRPCVRAGKVGTKGPEPAPPYTVSSGESRHGVEPGLQPRGNSVPEPAGPVGGRFGRQFVVDGSCCGLQGIRNGPAPIGVVLPQGSLFRFEYGSAFGHRRRMHFADLKRCASVAQPTRGRGRADGRDQPGGGAARGPEDPGRPREGAETGVARARPAPRGRRAPVWLKTGHYGPFVAHRRAYASVAADIPGRRAHPGAGARAAGRGPGAPGGAAEASVVRAGTVTAGQGSSGAPGRGMR